MPAFRAVADEDRGRLGRRCRESYQAALAVAFHFHRIDQVDTLSLVAVVVIESGSTVVVKAC